MEGVCTTGHWACQQLAWRTLWSCGLQEVNLQKHKHKVAFHYDGGAHICKLLLKWLQMIMGGQDGHTIYPHYCCNRRIDCGRRIRHPSLKKSVCAVAHLYHLYWYGIWKFHSDPFGHPFWPYWGPDFLSQVCRSTSWHGRPKTLLYSMFSHRKPQFCPHSDVSVLCFWLQRFPVSPSYFFNDTTTHSWHSCSESSIQIDMWSSKMQCRIRQNEEA